MNSSIRMFTVPLLLVLLYINILGNIRTQLNKNIWIIGDSHAAYCFTNYPNQIPWPNYLPKRPEELWQVSHYIHPLDDKKTIDIPFYIYWISGRTMHRVGRDGIEGVNIKKIGVQDNDIVVFCFGSIDRDVHVLKNEEIPAEEHKQMATRDMYEVIDSLCKKYIETITLNAHLYKNLTVVILGVIPVKIHQFMYDNFNDIPDIQKDLSVLKMQVKKGKTINETLEYYCKKNNYIFLDIYQEFQTENGDLNVALSAGDHHIHPKYNYLVKEKLMRYVL